MHASRLQRRGDINAPDGRKRVGDKPMCSVSGCDHVSHGRGICLMHYKRERRRVEIAQRLPKPPKPLKVKAERPRCEVDACNVAAYRNGLCSPHGKRKERYGDPLAPTPPRERRPVKRYRKVLAAGHPLDGGSGLILEHRKVLFDAIGWGPHHCYWCGRFVDWQTGQDAIRALVVDHLDHCKTNNTVENLVPSCNGCNGKRYEGESWEPWKPGEPIGMKRLQGRCRRGHGLTPSNVYTRPGGSGRQCLTCIRERRQERTERATRAEVES